MIDIFNREVLRQCGEPRQAVAAGDHFPSLTRARGMSPEQLVEIIERSGLTGKGGAGFPTYRKIELMQRQVSYLKYLVVNGSEHEPGSLKDRHLLENYPATVLEGALILAHATGVCDVQITVNESAVEAISLFNSAIEMLAASGDLQIRRKPSVSITVVPVPESYMVGEESALLEVLEGRQPLPRKRPPFPIEAGLYGLPTLIQNVETVAHLPYIITYGSDSYRSLGVNEKGVTLCTFGDEFENGGVQLIPLGISLREVVYEYGGGLKSGKSIKAVQPGGPSAGFLVEAQLDVPFQGEALKLAGSALGCAAIRAFSHDDDMVAAVAEIMEFFARNSCGQCPSCRMETKMLSSIMKQTLSGRGNARLLKQIPVIINANVTKGICGLIKMPVDPMLSALSNFGDEFDGYMVDGGRKKQWA